MVYPEIRIVKAEFDAIKALPANQVFPAIRRKFKALGLIYSSVDPEAPVTEREIGFVCIVDKNGDLTARNLVMQPSERRHDLAKAIRTPVSAGA